MTARGGNRRKSCPLRSGEWCAAPQSHHGIQIAEEPPRVSPAVTYRLQG